MLSMVYYNPMMKMKKAHLHRVVVVGGGFGGVKTALQLAKNPRCNVTLVSDKDSLVYYPLLYATATGAARKISSIPLATICAHTTIRVVRDTIVGIDDGRKIVVGESGQYEYDSVVFALGVVTNYFGIEGLQRYSWSIKSPEGVQAFRRHLHDELVAERHFDKHYVVVGAGPTGVELAASLKDYLLRVGARHGLRQHNVNITLVEATSRVLPRMSEHSSRAALKRLRRLGVHVLLGTAVKKMDDDTLVVGERSIATETVVWTSGVANHPFFAAHPHVFHRNARGMVVVNEYLEAAPHVFVIGDSAATKYAGLAQTALRDAHVVARVIEAGLRGVSPPVYTPAQPISVVPVGHYYAVLEHGSLRLRGFLASALRKLADFIGYNDLLPFREAVSLWLSERQAEELDCELCQKNNNPSRVARTS